jgi:c-di-GMP-binding flagellar brake protein YcgR
VNLEAFLSLNDKLDVTIWRAAQNVGTDATPDDAFSYRSSLLDIQDGKILVYAPAEDAEAFDWVRQGQKVRIVITRPNGLWSFFPTVGQFVLKGSPRFWLKLPEDIEHIQRRKHVRVKYTFPLQLTIETRLLPNQPVLPNKPLPIAKPTAHLLLQSIDISAGGIRFKATTPFATGQLVTVKFTLTPELGEITNLARIVYCFSGDESPACSTTLVTKVPSKSPLVKKDYTVALQFIDLPRDTEKRIIQECFHLELEQHRKGVR